MHVQPERPVEHRLGNQDPVGRGDHGVHLGIEGVVQPLGLANLDPEPLGRLLGRGSRHPPAPSARPVRPGQEIRDVVLLREPLEHIGAQRSRRGDGEPGHLPDENRLRPQERERLPAGLRRRPVEDQHAVEVIELVLRDPRGQAFQLEPDLFPLGVGRLDRHPLVPFDRDHDALERKAALDIALPLVGALGRSAG